MRGIPLTQITALMFFVPMVLGEVLNLCALTFFHQSGVRKTDYDGCWALRAHSWWLKAINPSSIAIHEFLSAFLLLNIMHPDFEPPLGIFLLLLAGFSISFVALHFLTSKVDEEEVATAIRVIVSKSVYAVVSPSVIGSTVGGGLFLLFIICFIVNIAFLLGIVAVPLLALSYLSTLFGHVLGIPRTALGQVLLHSFLLNIAIAVLGYAYVFNGTGTENPSWVGVFG
ncbi:hypothetical protein BGZ61DRAFT_463503 [Ilyonectria robusta]|uniref:uncharacterized protein n=1 Tax=Ilyonectria robusta TaxID=1079257 RepID=UPI001E8DBD22|nr:uncharacterized protein BGZ61DRAFT_463503 [Ilyonectria robusta]KAH8661712.1 hypothetical protein BGZ61DRAFT_463503 [Ilyonectria robusta]